MKIILKKVIFPVFLSVLCGAVCGKIIYNIYLNNSDLVLENNVIYLIQAGAYSTYDNMRANTLGYDYVYYEEDNLFKTIIGITKNKENIEKIKVIYGKEIIVNEYYTENKKLNNKINEYDELLLKEKDNDKIKEIIVSMLNLYKNNDDNKLIKVS